MSVLRFGLTYDYRCPFARNVHEHVLAGLGDGADWEVHFVPFSLSQVHVEEGEPAVWDDPAQAPELLALAASVAVRERWPAQFLAVHRALFEARHDAGGDLRSAEVVAHALAGAGLEPDTVLAEVEAGWPAAQVRAEHEQAVSEHQVFGVPTFLVGSEAAFVRLMVRPGADPSSSRAIIEQLVTLVGQQTEINEVKHTSVPR